MPAAWLEATLVVDAELAEAVAEVLARFAPNGVVIESTTIMPDDEGEGYPAGPVRVSAYLPADENLEETRHRLEESLWYLGRIWPENPLPEPQFKPIQDQNWMDAWKEYYKPIPIGTQLMVLPAWIESTFGDRIPIRMEPGMAFGTGAHPTTQLCLEFVEDLVQPGQPVIDVGCGSGILSIAALKLGASHALGVDIDQQAIEVAQKSAELNGVASELELGTGSVEEIRGGGFSIRQAPLVLANILAPIIIRLLNSGLDGLVAVDGWLVLSGILSEQWEDDAQPPAYPLKETLIEKGFQIQEVRQMGDWVAVCAKKRQAPE